MSRVEVVTYVCVSNELTYVTSGEVIFCICHKSKIVISVLLHVEGLNMYYYKRRYSLCTVISGGVAYVLLEVRCGLCTITSGGVAYVLLQVEV